MSELLLEKTCPKCGRHLVCQDGRYGEFLGCSGYPACRYTKRGADIEYIYKLPSPYCNKCNHTGLLPLLNKQGAIVPFAWAYCDCHPIYGLNPEPEHYSRLKPEHFDFPCSDSFRGYTFEEYTGRDPAYPYSEYPKRVLSYPEEVTPDKTYIVEHIRSYVPPLKLTERIKQLEADIDGLKKGYHTHPDKKRTERYIIK